MGDMRHSGAESALGQQAAAEAGAAGGDHRVAPRFTLLLRMAKLICGRGEFLCIVRDVSETGASVKLFHPLPAAGDMLLELPNGDRHPVETVWQDEGKAGFRFRRPADLSRLIENPSEFPKRPVRVSLTVPAELCFAGRVLAAEIRNISQQGALIACGEKLPIFQRLMLRAPEMPEIRAKVRWRRDDECGLVFEDTFQFGELAQVVFAMQNAAPQPARPDAALGVS